VQRQFRSFFLSLLTFSAFGCAAPDAPAGALGSASNNADAGVPDPAIQSGNDLLVDGPIKFSASGANTSRGQRVSFSTGVEFPGAPHLKAPSNHVVEFESIALESATPGRHLDLFRRVER
jgi:hypothetical protein